MWRDRRLLQAIPIKSEVIGCAHPTFDCANNEMSVSVSLAHLLIQVMLRDSELGEDVRRLAPLSLMYFAK